ncbi:unnamed protein product [Alopecurus aequalis]
MDLGFAVTDTVVVDPKNAVGREGWTAVKCSSKRAYGCGKRGNSAVQDLDLFVHHGDLENKLSSSLSVRAGDKVFRWIDKVIAEKRGRPVFHVEDDKDRYFRSKVEIVDKGLIVLTSSFAEYGGFDYYIVFDYVDGSLSMIPHLPDSATCYTRCPLPLRHDDGGYSLALFGYGREEGKNNLLWQWSPLRYQLDRDDDGVWPVEVYRTMGCAGGALKFVAIDKSRYGHGTRVKVWTLAPSSRSGEWKLYNDLRLKNLRKDFKSAGLPNNLPMCPILREQEEATLYFILADQETQRLDWGPKYKYYLCRLDMPTKTLLQSKLLAHTTMNLEPVILPSGFFDYLDPLPSSPETNNSSPEIMLMEA